MTFIKNKAELCAENQELREAGLSILEAGLEAIDTANILRQKMINLETGSYERIFFIGIGKCALDGAVVIEEILGDKLTDGIVLDVRTGALKKIKSYVGTHPFPSETNENATREILQMVQGLTERDLVLVLVSGGGSALLCLPHDMNCQNLTQITQELMQNGADIYELNTVRKHLSEVQGGGLAKILFPAQVVSFIFSDVLGNDISMIASGPTVLDQTTVADAQKVLEKYSIELGQELLETPKDPKYFEKVNNILVVSNHNALIAMQEKAKTLGYQTTIVTETLSGEAKRVGQDLARQSLGAKTCLLYGGETVVKVAPGGVGGRNQDLVLAALPSISEGTMLISCASDGFDNTDHAGAIADKNFYEKSKTLRLDVQDFLARSDSYNFWRACGGAICTGRLGSNVSDLVIMIMK